MSLVTAKALKKTYIAGDITVRAIRGIDFIIEPASFVSFVGPSGSGKSTLLNMIGCLDPPTSGFLEVAGQEVTHFRSKESARFRGDHIGFIFQDFNLIPVLTVFENIEYPLQMVQNWPTGKRKQRVHELLEAVGMKDQGNKFPSPQSDFRRPETAGRRGTRPGDQCRAGAR